MHIKDIYNAQKRLSLLPFTESHWKANVSNPGAWRLVPTNSVTMIPHNNITCVWLAGGSKREPVKACNKGKVAAQISFVVVETAPSLPCLKTRIVLFAGICSIPKIKQTRCALSCEARKTASKLMPFVRKQSDYARQPLHGEWAITRVLKEDSILCNSDVCLSSNLIR